MYHNDQKKPFIMFRGFKSMYFVEKEKLADHCTTEVIGGGNLLFWNKGGIAWYWVQSNISPETLWFIWNKELCIYIL